MNYYNDYLKSGQLIFSSVGLYYVLPLSKCYQHLYVTLQVLLLKRYVLF